MKTHVFPAALTIMAALILPLTTCNGQMPDRDKQARTRVEPGLNARLAPHAMRVGNPVFIRIIKEEHILELWGKPDKSETWLLIKRYPIAGMSGTLGPKQREGDYQAPEGFYEVTPAGLNPKSNYHLSFNIGYPNAYDRALGRTGSLIMVHGSNVSIGCFAITDAGIEEVYTMVAAALQHGQPSVPVQIHPFVPSIDRLAREEESEHFSFWKVMAKAWEYTERQRRPARAVVNEKSLTIKD